MTIKDIQYVFTILVAILQIRHAVSSCSDNKYGRGCRLDCRCANKTECHEAQTSMSFCSKCEKGFTVRSQCQEENVATDKLALSKELDVSVAVDNDPSTCAYIEKNFEIDLGILRDLRSFRLTRGAQSHSNFAIHTSILPNQSFVTTDYCANISYMETGDVICSYPRVARYVLVRAGLRVMHICEFSVYVCSDYTYGDTCDQQCKCLNPFEVCNKTTGECPSGCYISQTSQQHGCPAGSTSSTSVFSLSGASENTTQQIETGISSTTSVFSSSSASGNTTQQTYEETTTPNSLFSSNGASENSTQRTNTSGTTPDNDFTGITLLTPAVVGGGVFGVLIILLLIILTLLLLKRKSKKQNIKDETGIKDTINANDIGDSTDQDVEISASQQYAKEVDEGGGTDGLPNTDGLSEQNDAIVNPVATVNHVEESEIITGEELGTVGNPNGSLEVANAAQTELIVYPSVITVDDHPTIIQ